jgi:soluble lytic murein transglycosylase-like protein
MCPVLVRKIARIALATIAALFAICALAFAGAVLAAPPVRIPDLSVVYRLKLEREAAAVFGLDAPVARLAAQVHQESRWDATAKSPYAVGLMQFTPATAEWLAVVYPECAPADPLDPDWSLRCGIRYDAYLYERNGGADACARWAFTLSDYNGGAKWRRRDQALAAKAGAAHDRWFGAVENHRSRGVAAHEENRGYVRRILTVLEPAYIAAGWPGVPACP